MPGPNNLTDAERKHMTSNRLQQIRDNLAQSAWDFTARAEAAGDEQGAVRDCLFGHRGDFNNKVVQNAFKKAYGLNDKDFALSAEQVSKLDGDNKKKKEQLELYAQMVAWCEETANRQRQAYSLGFSDEVMLHEIEEGGTGLESGITLSPEQWKQLSDQQEVLREKKLSGGEVVNDEVTFKKEPTNKQLVGAAEHLMNAGAKEVRFNRIKGGMFTSSFERSKDVYLQAAAKAHVRGVGVVMDASTWKKRLQSASSWTRSDARRMLALQSMTEKVSKAISAQQPGTLGFNIGKAYVEAYKNMNPSSQERDIFASMLSDDFMLAQVEEMAHTLTANGDGHLLVDLYKRALDNASGEEAKAKVRAKFEAGIQSALQKDLTTGSKIADTFASIAESAKHGSKHGSHIDLGWSKKVKPGKELLTKFVQRLLPKKTKTENGVTTVIRESQVTELGKALGKRYANASTDFDRKVIGEQVGAFLAAAAESENSKAITDEFMAAYLLGCREEAKAISKYDDKGAEENSEEKQRGVLKEMRQTVISAAVEARSGYRSFMQQSEVTGARGKDEEFNNSLTDVNGPMALVAKADHELLTGKGTKIDGRDVKEITETYTESCGQAMQRMNDDPLQSPGYIPTSFRP